jgi:hypothetical protein
MFCIVVFLFVHGLFSYHSKAPLIQDIVVVITKMDYGDQEVSMFFVQESCLVTNSGSSLFSVYRELTRGQRRWNERR